MGRLEDSPRRAAMARHVSLVAAVAGFLLLLIRWFHDPAVQVAGGYRVSAVAPIGLAFAGGVFGLAFWSHPMAAIVLASSALSIVVLLRAVGTVRAVVGIAARGSWWGLRRRADAETDRAAVELATWAAALPLAFFVLLQLGVLLGRGYSVPPVHYVVPLYLGVPSVVAVAVYHGLQHWSARAGGLTAAAILLWVAVPLPASIAWLRTLPDDQASMNASIAAMRAAAVDACIGPYWDAYRLSYLTLEEIICESIDVRRIPGYPDRVAERARPGRPAFVAAPQRADALNAHQESFEVGGLRWTRLQTSRFLVLLPR